MAEEERNLEAVRRWAELYNEDVARMVDGIVRRRLPRTRPALTQSLRT